MFDGSQIKKLKILLGIKNKDNATLFTYRLKKFIEKNGLEQNVIIKGINVILSDIHQKEIEQAQQKLKISLKGVKNPVLKKYGAEILQLHSEGLGARRIKKIMELEHNAKISHQTIYKFLKQNNKKEEKRDA